MTEDLRELALEAIRSSSATEDPDHPLWHLAPPVGRLNDPNGLFVEGATHHAFYQFSPFHPHRKLVYWGHATSTDLLNWTHHDPAIVPDSRYDRNGAYSGSAVPEARGVNLFYTGNVKDEVTGAREASQCLVTSTDLLTFTKSPDNPLIPHEPPGHTAHFRDPQVWRDPEGGYRMLIGAQRENLTGAALFYRSEDLHDWEFEGEMTFPDAGGAFDDLGFMWECPNLFRLRDELSGEVFDVLVLCPQGAAPAQEGFENVFPCVYVLGHLDGTALRNATGALTELDRGFEFYAPQVFARRADEGGPVLLLGWIGNAGEDDQPSVTTGGWVHCLTMVRELRLRGGRLLQRPVLVEAAGGSTVPMNGATVPLDGATVTLDGAGAAVDLSLRETGLNPSGAPVPELAGSRTFHLVVELDSEPTGPWGLRVGSEECHLDVTWRDGALLLDRSTTRYPHGGTRTVTLPEGCTPRLEVVHDRSVTEVFVGDGEIALSLRTFLEPGVCGVQLFGDGSTGVVRARALRGD